MICVLNCALVIPAQIHMTRNSFALHYQTRKKVDKAATKEQNHKSDISVVTCDDQELHKEVIKEKVNTVSSYHDSALVSSGRPSEV